MECREIIKEGHICDPNVIENIRSIATDTKPCPSCAAAVFRTDGCSHMFCTHCRTHFDWVSGRVLVTSTNHHYAQTSAFAQNVARRTQTTASPNSCLMPTDTDAVPSKNVPKERQKRDLYRILYEESKQARQMLLQLFDTRRIMEAHDTALIQLRIKFLRNQLTEEQIKAKIFIAESSVQKKLEYAQLLTLFLSTTNDIQIKWSQELFQSEDQLLILMQNLVALCDEEAAHLQAEYGGSRIKFNTKWQADSLPMITMD